VWWIKGIRRHTDKGRCPLCLGEEDVKHLLLDYLETGIWRMKFLDDRWFSMNKEVAYRKTLRCSNKDYIRNL
jgi:hypothetical protein